VVPAEKKYLFVKDIRNPQLYGGEYGGLVQDFLQTIVANRHDQNYLRDILTEQDMLDLQLTEEELVSYENTVRLRITYIGVVLSVLNADISTINMLSNV